MTEFNFDTPYGRHALRAMYNAICTNCSVPGVAMTTVLPGVREGTNEFYVFNTKMKVQWCMREGMEEREGVERAEKGGVRRKRKKHGRMGREGFI